MIALLCVIHDTSPRVIVSLSRIRDPRLTVHVIYPDVFSRVTLALITASDRKSAEELLRAVLGDVSFTLRRVKMPQQSSSERVIFALCEHRVSEAEPIKREDKVRELAREFLVEAPSDVGFSVTSASLVTGALFDARRLLDLGCVTKDSVLSVLSGALSTMSRVDARVALERLRNIVLVLGSRVITRPSELAEIVRASLSAFESDGLRVPPGLVEELSRALWYSILAIALPQLVRLDGPPVVVLEQERLDALLRDVLSRAIVDDVMRAPEEALHATLTDVSHHLRGELDHLAQLQSRIHARSLLWKLSCVLARLAGFVPTAWLTLNARALRVSRDKLLVSLADLLERVYVALSLVRRPEDVSALARSMRELLRLVEMVRSRGTRHDLREGLPHHPTEKER